MSEVLVAALGVVVSVIGAGIASQSLRNQVIGLKNEAWANKSQLVGLNKQNKLIETELEILKQQLDLDSANVAIKYTGLKRTGKGLAFTFNVVNSGKRSTRLEAVWVNINTSSLRVDNPIYLLKPDEPPQLLSNDGGRETFSILLAPGYDLPTNIKTITDIGVREVGEREHMYRLDMEEITDFESKIDRAFGRLDR
jgi:hypothetical protein